MPASVDKRIDREALIKAAFCAWNGVDDWPDYEAERAKYPLSWEGWGRVVDAITRLAPSPHTGTSTP